MQIDLTGDWKIKLSGNMPADTLCDWDGSIALPGILQAQGYGEEVTQNTNWISGLHDPLWHIRADYQYAQEDGCNVPFLSQPPRHFVGKAWYQREVTMDSDECWTLYMELTHWKTSAWLDGVFAGADCSLCTAHEICLGNVEKGIHTLLICIDNSMQYPYRPDGHGVSDALAATWNGVAGEFKLLSTGELGERQLRNKEYARNHQRTVQVKNGMFYVDGRPEYFRGTHFGGDYPMTGCPETEKVWWERIMKTVKDWGLNFIRCHSYCPPEAAFMAADEAGVYIQAECGMWNVFNDGIEMLEVLCQETKRILKQFGHHPSFVLLSPTNEPDGNWYEPLKKWVLQAREYDKSLGYEDRRLYTAQSGWFYDVPPKEIEGTDYIYFHRSAYGPILGGNIRNHQGWKGKDYLPSLEGARLPVICHEMGQWCSYPDFEVVDKFQGYMKPGNYKIFRENAVDRGVYSQNKEFVYNSGRNQVRMYKEDLEANFRTPHMYGYELLDLHDYLGQGTALVGVLDAFWEEKGYIKPEEWRQFCSETVILARISSYVYKSTDKAVIPVEICHFGREILSSSQLVWKLMDENSFVLSGNWETGEIPIGKNFNLGEVILDFSVVTANKKLVLEISIGEIRNSWEIYVYHKDEMRGSVSNTAESPVVVTKKWQEAKSSLEQGKRVVYFPFLSSLDYDCPPLAMRPVFWNAQMGPNWIRPLGLVVNECHPIFTHFPTGKAGGWQWEDILSRSRGLFSKDVIPAEAMMVQPVDDWNRNLLQSLIFECRVGAGKLIFVSADLEGSFEERPSAWSLRHSILSYASSEAFQPDYQVEAEVFERHFSPNHVMRWLGASVTFDEGVEVLDVQNLLDGNPNTSIAIVAESYPITLQLTLKNEVCAKGFLYMADQKDRMHEGDVKEYKVLAKVDGNWFCAAKGCLMSTERQQKILFDVPVNARNFRFQILSCFQPQIKTIWSGKEDGWYQEQKQMQPLVRISILNIITDMEVPENDMIYWDKSIRSTTKEIDD